MQLLASTKNETGGTLPSPLWLQNTFAPLKNNQLPYDRVCASYQRTPLNTTSETEVYSAACLELAAAKLREALDLLYENWGGDVVPLGTLQVTFCLYFDFCIR